MNGQVRVAIVEDQREIREGLRFLIDGTPGYACSGAHASMEDALIAVSPATTDIVLTDLGLPGMSGIEGIRRFKERFADLPIVALTVYDDDDRIFAALCAGATGYLLKKTPPAKLLDGLADARRGGAPMSPDVATKVIALFRRFRPPLAADYDLTPHETRLLALLAQGHSYKSAAAALGNSVNTVAFHMKSVYLKLQVHSKSEAVAKALREGLVR
ncbi:MAG: response regulator transcription factor [Acidobacteria bacterium]|nr:response regulator transcription factor [Acidobacteriota bacterium]